MEGKFDAEKEEGYCPVTSELKLLTFLN